MPCAVPGPLTHCDTGRGLAVPACAGGIPWGLSALPHRPPPKPTPVWGQREVRLWRERREGCKSVGEPAGLPSFPGTMRSTVSMFLRVPSRTGPVVHSGDLLGSTPLRWLFLFSLSLAFPPLCFCVRDHPQISDPSLCFQRISNCSYGLGVYPS